MIDTSFLKQLDRFSLIVNKRVTSNYSGSRLSPAHGRGMVIKDHRIYVPGDDIRSIDWKVYARTDKLHIKKYEEERSLNVHIILDSSSSMNFGRPNSKFEYAAMLGLGFAYLAYKGNEKFRYSTFDEDLRIFKPQRGMNQIAGMIDHVNKIKPKGVSQLLKSLVMYKKTINTSSLIVIISDFLIDMKEIREALVNLGKHQVKVIQVLDKKEVDLNLTGDLRLYDSETRGVVRTFISQRLRKNYQDKLTQHIFDIQEECDLLGYDFKLVTTDKPIFDSFFELLKRR